VKLTYAPAGDKEGHVKVVDHFRSWKNKTLPAQEAGGRYKWNGHHNIVVFVAAAPFRVLRDGAGMFVFRLDHYPGKPAAPGSCDSSPCTQRAVVIAFGLIRVFFFSGGSQREASDAFLQQVWR
jgi:hypothetical protein